jgi:hypothetical protein
MKGIILGSFDFRIASLCEYIASDDLTNKQRDDLAKTVTQQLDSHPKQGEFYSNAENSSEFLTPILREKYVSAPDELTVFLREIKENMGENYPLENYKSNIEFTLWELSELYKTYDNKDPENRNETKIFYVSKLAILELSAWIECSIDDAIVRFFNGASEKTIKDVTKKISRTNGFEYEDKIRPLISETLGFKEFEAIEKELDNQSRGASLTVLQESLKTLSNSRNQLAHTFSLKNLKRNLDTPPTTLGNFKTLQPHITRLCELIENPPR